MVYALVSRLIHIFPTSKASLFLPLYDEVCHSQIPRRPNLQRTLLWGKFHEAKQGRMEGWRAAAVVVDAVAAVAVDIM